jgi:hypothetical protein
MVPKLISIVNNFYIISKKLIKRFFEHNKCFNVFQCNLYFW